MTAVGKLVPTEPGAPQVERPLWLAVRRAVADSIALPSEAIQPRDRLVFWLCVQYIGRAFLDIACGLGPIRGVVQIGVARSDR